MSEHTDGSAIPRYCGDRTFISTTKIVSSIQVRLKSWSSLINDPFFVSLHLSKSMQNLTRTHNVLVNCSIHDGNSRLRRVLSFSVNGTGFSAAQIHFPTICENGTGFIVSNHCNGILCFCCMCRQHVVLCNPETKQSWFLRNSDDSIKVIFATGIGYDPRTSDYKVVKICYSDKSGNPRNIVEEYSLSTNCWRRMQNTNANDFSFDCLALHLKGVFYWSQLKPGLSRILAMNVGDEVFEEVPLPIAENVGLNVFEWNGSISLIHTSCCWSSSLPNAIYKHDIWVMKDGFRSGNSWTKRLSILILPPLFVSHPLCFWNDNELLVEGSRKLWSYNTDTKGIKHVNTLPPDHYFFSNKGVNYVKSLVSINGGNRVL